MKRFSSLMHAVLLAVVAGCGLLDRAAETSPVAGEWERHSERHSGFILEDGTATSTSVESESLIYKINGDFESHYFYEGVFHPSEEISSSITRTSSGVYSVSGNFIDHSVTIEQSYYWIGFDSAKTLTLTHNSSEYFELDGDSLSLTPAMKFEQVSGSSSRLNGTVWASQRSFFFGETATDTLYFYSSDSLVRKYFWHQNDSTRFSGENRLVLDRTSNDGTTYIGQQSYGPWHINRNGRTLYFFRNRVGIRLYSRK